MLTACSLLDTLGCSYKSFPSFLFFLLSPSTHPSIHPCACLARYFRTIKVDFMLRGAFHHNGERSGTRERLVKGIFNSCHSHCMPLYVPCLLAQLTAPNMVPCSARLHRRRDLKRFNGTVPQLKLYCMQDAVRKQREAGQPQLHVIFLLFVCCRACKDYTVCGELGHSQH